MLTWNVNCKRATAKSWSQTVTGFYLVFEQFSCCNVDTLMVALFFQFFRILYLNSVVKLFQNIKLVYTMFWSSLQSSLLLKQQKTALWETTYPAVRKVSVICLAAKNKKIATEKHMETICFRHLEALKWKTTLLSCDPQSTTECYCLHVEWAVNSTLRRLTILQFLTYKQAVF